MSTAVILPRVDFLDDDPSRRLDGRMRIIAVVATAAVVGLLLAFVWLFMQSQTNKEQAEQQLSNATTHLSTANARSARTSAADAQAPAPAADAGIVGVLRSRRDWPRLLVRIADVLPTSSWLLSLSTDPAQGAAAGAAPANAAANGTVSLSGCATSTDAVADAVRALTLMPGATDVNLTETSTSGASAGGGATGGATPSAGATSCPTNTNKFTITLALKPPTAKAAAAAKPGAVR